MEKILAEAIAALVSGRTVALSTILSGSGSLPMSRRSKMLVLPDGTLRGTVGGGCLEAEVYASAKEVLGGESSPRIRRFVLTESEAGAEGLNCGGTVEILTEAVTPGSVVAVLEACLGMLERREDAVLATRLDAPGAEGPGKLLLGAGGRVAGSLGDAALEEKAAQIASGMMGRDSMRLEEVAGAGRIFLESIPVTPVLVLFGGGHVSRETAQVAASAGFRGLVADDRPAYASRERHPSAHETRVISFDRALDGIRVDGHTYLVVVTRGHQHDETVLRQVLRSGARYVGMIGSARKVALARQRLAAEGFRQEDLDRLHAPVGIEIGADTPGEIAVSIVAEMIAVRRRGGHPATMSLSGRNAT